MKKMDKPMTAETGDKIYWHYIICRYKDNSLGVHEGYFRNGRLEAKTVEPIIIAETRKELLDVLEMIKKDIKKQRKFEKYD